MSTNRICSYKEVIMFDPTCSYHDNEADKEGLARALCRAKL